MLSCWLPSSLAYQGVVVDAKTWQPLPAATVQLLEGLGGQVTDATGHFTLAGLTGPTIHLRVSSLGYASAEVTRPLQVGPDTIRLTAVAEALPGVVVRPRQVETLQPFAKPPKISKGYYLLPSSDFAIALPTTAGQASTLSQVRIQLRPSKHAIAAGGLRVRLLARPAPATSLVEGPAGPDLLLHPLLVSASQLASAPNGLLLLDLLPYHLPMPATGLYVLLEGSGNSPQQQYISLTQPGKGQATYEVHQLADYPELAIAETTNSAATCSRDSNGKGWHLHQLTDGKLGNALVAVVVVPD